LQLGKRIKEHALSSAAGFEDENCLSLSESVRYIIVHIIFLNGYGRIVASEKK
jgi:hypothetical protein